LLDGHLPYPHRMPRLHIIHTSTRDGRVGRPIADWVLARATKHGGFETELIDLKVINLPLFDEPRHPRFRQYEHAHTKAWSASVEKADAFVFVMPEYNHGAPPALVNALDYVYVEWNYKPVAFVSYGGVAGGTRSVQIIKPTLLALKMVPIVEAVTIPFFTKLLDGGVFVGGEPHDQAAEVMFGELVRWTAALKTLRS